MFRSAAFQVANVWCLVLCSLLNIVFLIDVCWPVTYAHVSLFGLNKSELYGRWMHASYSLLTRYEKQRVAYASGMPESFPHNRLQRKSLVNDPGMHYDTCVTHVPWCMSESLTRCSGENVTGIPGACATRNYVYLQGTQGFIRCYVIQVVPYKPGTAE